MDGAYMRRLFSRIPAFSLLTAMIGCTSPTANQPGEPVELTLVSMYGATHPSTVGWGKVFADTLKELSGSRLTVKWLGGPEVMPAASLPEAISKGMIDIAITSASYADALVPGAGANCLSLLSPTEERTTGFFDVYNEMMATVNIYHLARPDYPSSRVLFLTRPITKPGDLSGVNLRSIATDKPLISAMGAVPISMPIGDVYDALERGVINGVFMSWPTAAENSWQEVVSYVVDHNLYLGGGQIVLWMNLDVFKKLPQQSQMWLEAAAVEAENFAGSYWEQVTSEKRALFDAEGIKFITFSGPDYAWYVGAFFENSWAEYLKSAPVWGPKLKAASRDWQSAVKRQ